MSVQEVTDKVYITVLYGFFSAQIALFGINGQAGDARHIQILAMQASIACKSVKSFDHVHYTLVSAVL